MKQNKTLSKQTFSDHYAPIIKGYSNSFKNVISSLEELNQIIFEEKETIEIYDLLVLAEQLADHYVASLIHRLVAILEIKHCRENDEFLDINLVWKLISKSIRIIPVDFTISSIGSQGFLSIPLYKLDESLETFDFIRLHIWDDSLNKYMDLQKCEDFSIHSHTFFARSWVITGKVKNDRYNFICNSHHTTHSFFDVVYNNSLNEVNQHTSKALNKQIDAELIKISEEIYMKNGYYEIRPSKLHKSGHTNSPYTSATFFSFTGKEGLGESFVIGPKNIQESEVNRKMNISPFYLLDKIEEQL